MIIEFNSSLTIILPELIGILVAVIAATSVIMPGIDRVSRRFFLSFYIVLILIAMLMILDVLTFANSYPLSVTRVLAFFEYLFLSIPTLLVFMFVNYCCGIHWKESILAGICSIFYAIYVFLLILAQFTQIFYYFRPNGEFVQTHYLPLLYAPLVVIMMLNLLVLFTHRKNLSKRYFYGFLVFIISLTIASIIHSFSFNLALMIIASITGSITLYVLILTDQIQHYLLQQADLANQKANVLILQMRPHFIYNTMTSIYYLVDQNPKQAQQVILDFTSYLRKNFDAISSSQVIPFSEELEHVRAYLAVELVQFEDYLSVEYDTRDTNFSLPPLTLEPLVENTIKYGMDPDAEPLHILIQTQETDSAHVIIVKDNGPGFDAEGVFDKNNALSNIRQRLDLMCKGSIHITTSTAGGGTLINISIPK